MKTSALLLALQGTICLAPEELSGAFDGEALKEKLRNMEILD